MSCQGLTGRVLTVSKGACNWKKSILKYLYICHFPNKKICIQFSKTGLLELVMNEQAIQILLSTVADSTDMDMVCV